MPDCLRKHLHPHLKEVNARNKMEGGPKGVTVHGSHLALCSPEYGVKIFRFREWQNAA